MRSGEAKTLASRLGECTPEMTSWHCMFAGMIAAHWPERLYRAFVINMPGFFSILWKLIEPLMAQSTRKKIRLLRGKAVSILSQAPRRAYPQISSMYSRKTTLRDVEC